MNRSMPGLPVQLKLPESTQTHVHRVGDAIQPSHPLSPPSPPAPHPSQHQGLFQLVNSSHEVAKINSCNYYQLKEVAQKLRVQLMFFGFLYFSSHSITVAKAN